MALAAMSMHRASIEPTDTSMPPVTMTMVMPMEMVATTATLVRMLLMFPKVRNEGCVRSNSTLPMTSSAATLTSRRANRTRHVPAGLSTRTPSAAGRPLACSSIGRRLLTACSFAMDRADHPARRRQPPHTRDGGIVGDGQVAEQALPFAVLGQIGDAQAQRLGGRVNAYRAPVHQDLATLGRLFAEDGAGHLAAPRADQPEEAHDLAGPQLEADVLIHTPVRQAPHGQHRLGCTWAAVGDALQQRPAGHHLDQLRVGDGHTRATRGT